MADLRTTVTELATGLGTLGYPSLADAISGRPAEMVSVAPETWALLSDAFAGGALADDFRRAWENGAAFLAARDGLRGRRPLAVEWKGAHRPPGDAGAPVDLRIDHVFLVSCKYRSRILINASPAHLFDALLQDRPAPVRDWFAHVAAEQYQALYAAVRPALAEPTLPQEVTELSAPQRRLVAEALRAGWPDGAAGAYRGLCEAVASASAARWEAALARPSAAEALLWRLLRIGSAPYYLLGTLERRPLRLRIATPWDWRRQFRLCRLSCSPQPGGQPRVGWEATVEVRHSGLRQVVGGHVEIRWSHGRFGGAPEAKVYLDTPHSAVPGYFPLG